MSGKIKGLLFDKDGTLYDFQKTWAAWTRDFITLIAGPSGETGVLAEAFGFDMTRGTFAPGSAIIAATPDTIAGIAHRTLPHLDRRTLDRQLAQSSAEVSLAEAAPLAPLLDHFLANGLTLGLATNDLEAVAKAHLATSAITDKFAFVAGFDSGHGAKPDPGMLLAFCQSTSLAADQVAMVGDSRHDLIAGRAAGMRTIAVLTGPADAAELAPFADVTLAHIGQIPHWLGLP